jgi:predicted  nucleic acid-binding Zn-ribbon protein
MEKPSPSSLADLAEFLQLLTDRIDLFEKKIDADLVTVAEKILGSVFRLAEALQSRVSDLERSDASLKHRLAMLEERLTELEKKLNIPPERIQ